MPGIEFHALLDEFAHAKDMSALERAGESLAKGKLVNIARRDPRFETGIERCFKIGDTPIERLKGVALAFRLGASSRPVLTLVRTLAKEALSSPLPPLSLLDGAKDRYYVAIALEGATGRWLDEYVAQAIAEEDAAEIARQALTRGLFLRLSLSAALHLIARGLRQVAFETERPAESAAKRLKRIVASIRPTIVRQPIEPGDSLGRSMRALFESPFRPTAQFAGEKIWTQLAAECCGLVRDVLRTQLTVLADVEIYQSLQPVKNWVDPRLWNRFVGKTSEAQAVCAALEDAITLLAKQRVTDSSLLSTLEFVLGSRDEASRAARRIAAEHPEIPGDVRDWLSTFGRPSISPPLVQLASAREDDSDAYVAALLVRTRLALARYQELPGEARTPQLESLRSDIEQLALDVEHLASIRRLGERLQRGEVVDYSPSAHELVGGHRLGVRKVRVVEPLVERIGGHGATVVRKAIVEAALEGKL